MVITGPLLAQPIAKPPTLETEITKAFNTLKQVGSGNGTYTNKQSYPFGNDYVPQKSYDIPVDKSWKYADVFATVPQHNNYYSTNIEAFPVDNENVIPNTSSFVPQKEASNFTGFYDKNFFPGYDTSIPSKIDLDLSTLLASPFPMKQEASPGYVIPDQPLEFTYGNASPPTEDITPDNSMGIWTQTIPKDSPVEEVQSTGQTVDPFVNDFALEEPRLYPVPSTDSLLTEAPAQGSPLSAATVGSPMNQESPWENNFQQLLDAPFDFSDMDFFLPPPPKRMHDSPEPVLMSPQHPVSPGPMADAPSPIPEEDYVKPKPKAHSQSQTEKSRPKSTILFGKHEDEIIHKLLVPDLSTPSRPVTRDKLVSMPVEEFNHLLELAQLNDIEVAFMKEWRRRGKNKTAAQIARKRKREEVGDLEYEVEAMRQQKAELQSRYDQLRSQIKSLKERSLAAETRVYKQYSRSSGQSVSRDTHLIHVAHGNKLLLVPKISSKVISVN